MLPLVLVCNSVLMWTILGYFDRKCIGYCLTLVLCFSVIWELWISWICFTFAICLIACLWHDSHFPVYLFVILSSVRCSVSNIDISLSDVFWTFFKANIKLLTVIAKVTTFLYIFMFLVVVFMKIFRGFMHVTSLFCSLTSRGPIYKRL